VHRTTLSTVWIAKCMRLSLWKINSFCYSNVRTKMLPNTTCPRLTVTVSLSKIWGSSLSIELPYTASIGIRSALDIKAHCVSTVLKYYLFFLKCSIIMFDPRQSATLMVWVPTNHKSSLTVIDCHRNRL